MAYRDLQQQKARAKKLYTENGVRDAVVLSGIVDVPARTIVKWAKDGNWDSLQAIRNVTPEDIALEYLMRIAEIQREMKEMRSDEIPIAQSVYKELNFLHNALQKLDAQFQVKAMVIKWMDKYVEFIANLDMENKEAFIPFLEKTMPLFVDFVTGD